MKLDLLFEPFKKYHVIRNFPKGYSWYKKFFANFIYFWTGIVLHKRKNLLSRRDIIKARLLLRKGDILLLGNLKETSKFLFKQPLTHVALYLGRKRCIHVLGDGVQYGSLHHVFQGYDTLVILRVPKSFRGRRKIIKKAINYAKEQFGKPYDYDFKKGSKCFFCTELVNEAYRKAGYQTKLKSLMKPKYLIERVSNVVNALKPSDFLKGNFEIIFLSHNLKIRKQVILLKK